MKNILLLTDFSENANNAITYALEFLENEKCIFHLMHVHKMGSFTADNLSLSSTSNTIHETIVEIPKKKLESLVNDLQSKFKNNNHRFETIVDYDDFTDAINQILNPKKIDLIILGSNGKTGAKEIIFGSNTLNVIRKVNCTTLVIPEGNCYKKNKEILLPIDTTDDLHGNAIQELRKFIEGYKLNLNILRINTNKEHPEYEFFDQSNFATLPHNYFIINNVPVHHATNSFIQIKNIDITAIFVHPEKFFKRLFYGSTTSRISNSLKTPLLIFHNE